MKHLLLASLALGCTLSATALADPGASEPTCPIVDSDLDPYRYLRALSLDLRGVIPGPEDYAVVDEEGEVPEWLIDDWLDEPAFADRVVRLHRDLLWNNVSEQRLYAVPASLSSSDGILYRRNTPARTYRGGDVYCGNFEAEKGPDGEYLTYDDGEGRLQEGYVWVKPYWSPNEEVKVCAFDAQTNPVSPLGTDCSDRTTWSDPYCGCGPEMRWCSVGSERAKPAEAMGTDVDLRIANIVQNDLPWTEVLTGRTMYMNGPLAYYYKHQLNVYGGVRLDQAAVAADAIPDLDWADEDTWVPVELSEHSAGVLTSPGFLLRFQTNRSRANVFYNSFLCTPFQAPPDGIPNVTDADPTLDLTQRDGCNYCHELLEPSAAHWGRWTESGAGFLDPQLYPTFDETCEVCATSNDACSDECRRYYVTDALTSEEDPYIGYLRSYEFVGEVFGDNIDEGPKKLVRETMVDGRLAGCASHTAATWLMGSEPTDLEWVDDVAGRFSESNWSYKELVKDIVTSDNYRRVR